MHGHLLVVSSVIHLKLINTFQMNKPRAVLLFAYIIIYIYIYITTTNKPEVEN